MRKAIWLTLVFTMILILPGTVTMAATSSSVLVNPAGGLYNIEFINLTGKDLQVVVANTASTGLGIQTNSYYKAGSQLNVIGDNNTIKLNNILNPDKTHPPLWNGFILANPIVSGNFGSNPTKYLIADGLQSQQQTFTISDVSTPASPQTLATLNLSYVYSTQSSTNWTGVLTFVQSLLSPISKIAKAGIEAAGGDEDALSDVPESVGNLISSIVNTAVQNNNTLLQTGVSNDATLTTAAQTVTTPFNNYKITSYCQLLPTMQLNHGENSYVPQEIYQQNENLQVSQANTTITFNATYKGKSANRTYSGPELMLITDALYFSQTPQNPKAYSGVDKVYVVMLSGPLYTVTNKYINDSNKSALSALTVPQLMYNYGTSTETVDPVGLSNIVNDFQSKSLVINSVTTSTPVAAGSHK